MVFSVVVSSVVAGVSVDGVCLLAATFLDLVALAKEVDF